MTYRLESVAHNGRSGNDEQDLDQKQRDADLRRFGKRIIPLDSRDSSNVDLLSRATIRNQAYLPLSDVHKQASQVQLNHESSGSDNEEYLQIEIDKNKDLNIWLSTSVIPVHEPTSLQDNTLEHESQQITRELEDHRYLKRVQFTQLTAETELLHEALPDYRSMPLDKQIYLRKIVDKHSAQPLYLADRFAAGSIARRDRLKELRQTLSTSLMNSQIS